MASLYQKYRSQNFEEILTQDHVVDVLKGSLINQTFGHAYLFFGTRGTGKTSLARIFARAINCLDKAHVTKTGEPCNNCESCKLSLENSHPDILEMDAASNRGIDEVRNLKETVDYMPTVGSYKIYIIDEAHMMTKEAFNALLKTIEEPPKHVVFMMCTTELFKVLPTIISRSQVFELKHASIDEIVTKLDKILEAEGRNVELEGKRLIAKLGKGSFRDTESILEKVLNGISEKEISLELATQSLGLASVLLIQKVKEAAYVKNLQEVQSLIDTDLDEGTITNFNLQLADAIYEDIKIDLANKTQDKIKFELFEFLVGVEKDLRNTNSPKILYIAKFLNFLAEVPPAQSQAVLPAIKEVSNQTAEVKAESVPEPKISAPKPEQAPPVDPEKIKHNPAALLRQRKAATAEQEKEVVVSNQVAPSQSKKTLSKFDFLDQLKSVNMFIYRYFSNHDFEIKEGVVEVVAKRPMEKDLVNKPQTQEIVKKIGLMFEQNIKAIAVEELNPSATIKEVATPPAVKKDKVEDLSEADLKDIFKTK